MAKTTTAERISKLTAQIDTEKEKVQSLENQQITLETAIKEKKAHIKILEDTVNGLRGQNIMEIANAEGVSMEDIVAVLYNKELAPLIKGAAAEAAKSTKSKADTAKKSVETEDADEPEADEEDEDNEEDEESESDVEGDADAEKKNPWD